MLPIYLLVIAGLLALLIGGCVLYVQFYKRKINEALADTQKKRKAMPAPFNVAIMLLIAFLIFAVFMSFVIGFGMGYRSLDDDLDNPKDEQIYVQAFYAKVVNVDEYSITVMGIDLNEKIFRGEFTYDLPEDIIVEWCNENILMSDLQKDDMVSIILMKDKSGVEYIYKIQLLKYK